MRLRPWEAYAARRGHVFQRESNVRGPEHTYSGLPLRSLLTLIGDASGALAWLMFTRYNILD